MQSNPEIEISVSSPEYAWIRLHGKAVCENNMAAKEMCMQNPIVKSQYGEATNPILRCSISRMHTAVSLISPEIRRISLNSLNQPAKSLQADFFFPLHKLSIELTGRNSVY